MTIDNQLMVYRADDYPTYGNNDKMPIKINEEKLDFVPVSLKRSTNGEFFVAVTNENLMVYNLDLEEINYVEHKNSEVRWLDNYTLFDIVDGRMEVYDFDGENRRTILDRNLVAGFDAVINSNNRYLYYIIKTETGLSLQRDKLI